MIEIIDSNLPSLVITEEDVTNFIEDNRPAMRDWNTRINELLPPGTFAGVVRRISGRQFAFVSTPEGNAFVSPPLAKGFEDGDIVVVQTYAGPRGLAVDRIVEYDTYSEWHKDEWFVAAKTLLERERSNEYDRVKSRFETATAKAAELGLTLVSVKDDYRASYGGRLVREITVVEPIDYGKANSLVDAFGRRSTAPLNGPVSQPNESVTLSEDHRTVVYRWVGGFTD